MKQGDALAASGDWLAAIDAWRVAASAGPAQRAAVERRLEWLLAETGTARGDRFRLVPWIAAFLVASWLAVLFLMLAGTPGSRSADLWAVATWTMVAVATVAALVAAKRSSGASLDRLVNRARRAAERLERQPHGERFDDL